MVLLHELSVTDLRRNMPMKDLDVECKAKVNKNWIPVKKMKIGLVCFNELGPSWLNTTEFRIPEVPMS